MIRLVASLACLIALLVALAQAGTGALRSLKVLGQPAIGTVAGPSPLMPDAARPDGVAPFEGRSLAAYPDTSAQPVFFEGRRYPTRAPKPALEPALTPPAPVVQVKPTPEPAPRVVASVEGIRLLGVVVGSGKPRALISAVSGAADWVTVGEKVQAWTVAEIRGNSVRLTRDSQSATLSMYGVSTSN